MIEVARGTVVLYADIACPWSHLAVFRFHEARRRAGADETLVLDPRPFLLEMVNARPTPRHILDAEIPVVGGLDPGAGWTLWQGLPHQYAVTSLPALEAVEAAKAQGARAAEGLDRALRRAFFAESKCISMRHVILEVAGRCPGVDVDELAAALDDGRARAALMRAARAAQDDERVRGSPHFFLPDGSDMHNPGIATHWEGGRGGFPVIEEDRPEVYDELIDRSLGTSS